MESAIFAILTFALMFVVARQVGWSLSRSVLYPGPAFIAYPVSIGWGVSVAVVVYGLINALDPNEIVKWVCGYLFGAYAADPAYGLVAEKTVPRAYWPRHLAIQILPIAAFIAALIAMVHFNPMQ